MFDASAKLPKTGMLRGRRHFPGNMDSCLEILVKDSELDFSGEVQTEDNDLLLLTQENIVSSVPCQKY